MQQICVLVVLIASIFATPVAHSACNGVEHVTSAAKGFVYDSWFVEGTGTPETVHVVIGEIEPGTTVEYYSGGQWITVNDTYEGDASQCRLTAGGYANISYQYNNCWDVVQPQDE